MNISAKGYYGLSCMVYLAQNYEAKKIVNLMTMATELKVSKLYLEQVFSLLKKSDLVYSIKGSRGGYQISKHPSKISVLDILLPLELNIFKSSTPRLSSKYTFIETAIKNVIIDKFDNNIYELLNTITLHDLLNAADGNNGIMYFI